MFLFLFNAIYFLQNSSNKVTLREEPLGLNEKRSQNNGITGGHHPEHNNVPDHSEFAMYCQLSLQTRNFYLKCPIETCGKTFIYISGLLGHLRTHQSCLLALIGNVSTSELETGRVTLNNLLVR